MKLNFRKEISESSLVYFPHILAVTIDATHARTRFVETDLRKIVDKLLHERTTDYQETVRRRLEKNSTDREVKPPCFRFSIEKNKCGPISLSGTDAEVAIAEIEDLGENFTSHLFDGVFSNCEWIPFNPAINPHAVMQNLHKDFFADGRVSHLKVAEWWRLSLNMLIKILRCSKQFNASEYKRWSEAYYQICHILFPVDEAITPYKVKLPLIKQSGGLR